MRYALVNDTKTEALKGLEGICPNCGSVVIARCGNVKIHHWSHKKTSNCDSWWENETEWHRNWKNHYPINWQEFTMVNTSTNEKHIADVRTEHGLVIEFQHSSIEETERKSRETFYENMVWVVDGTRLKGDFTRFSKSFHKFRRTYKKELYIVENSEEIFPLNWLNSLAPVIFDYKGTNVMEDPMDLRHYLYCLLPISEIRTSYFVKISRNAFIKSTTFGEWTIKFNNFINSLKPKIEAPHPINQMQAKQKPREGTHYFDNKKNKLVRRRRW
jgi:competence protein CoiA